MTQKKDLSSLLRCLEGYGTRYVSPMSSSFVLSLSAERVSLITLSHFGAPDSHYYSCRMNVACNPMTNMVLEYVPVNTSQSKKLNEVVKCTTRSTHSVRVSIVCVGSQMGASPAKCDCAVASFRARTGAALSRHFELSNMNRSTSNELLVIHTKHWIVRI